MKTADLNKQWVQIGSVHDILPGTGKTIRSRQENIALFRLMDGSVRAVENRCPHQNGVLAEGILSGDYVFCPMHDRKINLTTGEVQFPDTGCVRIYSIVIDDDGQISIGYADKNES